MARGFGITALLLAGLFAAPASARADELADFEAAREAYDEQRYADTIARLEAMVGGEVPAIQNEVLVLESRKYLGAAYIWEGRREEAETQFRLLLQADETYQVDPLAFPAAIVDVFREVRQRYLQERADAERERRERLERLNRERIQRMLRQQERMSRLEELATEQVVEERNSRGLALVPFGVGQFRNGNRRLGITLALGEAALVAGSLAFWGWHRWLRGQVDEVTPAERDRFERLERSARIGNQLFTALFATVTLAGILEAQINYVPVRTETRERPLPDDLPEVEPPELELEVGVGPGSAELRLRF